MLIGNPLIVLSIMGYMGYMGYRKRTGFLAGLTVAQISEFSIIFVAMGVSMGHVDQDALGLTTLVGIVTIVLSTYMIPYSQPLYERLAPWLAVFERRRPHRELAMERQKSPEEPLRVIVFGLGRYGEHLLARLQHNGVAAMGVDFDPETVRRLRQRGIGRHRHFALAVAQPGALHPQLGLPNGNHAALVAVPAHVTSVTSRVLGAGYRLGRQDEQLFDELA